MNFTEVIVMREAGGPFAGSLFLMAWFFLKTWMFWLGLIVGSFYGGIKKTNKKK